MLFRSQRLEREQRIVPREAERQAEQPPRVAERAQHGQRRQPVCSATTPIVMLRKDTLPKPAAFMRRTSSCGGGKRRIRSLGKRKPGGSGGPAWVPYRNTRLPDAYPASRQRQPCTETR